MGIDLPHLQASKTRGAEDMSGRVERDDVAGIRALRGWKDADVILIACQWIAWKPSPRHTHHGTHTVSGVDRARMQASTHCMRREWAASFLRVGKEYVAINRKGESK